MDERLWPGGRCPREYLLRDRQRAVHRDHRLLDVGHEGAGNLNLAGATYFAPIQAAADSGADGDLGSGGVILLPDQSGTLPHLLVACGKCSANNLGCFKYILNRDVMGGQQTGNACALLSANTGGGIWGGPAFFGDANGVGHIVYGGSPLN